MTGIIKTAQTADEWKAVGSTNIVAVALNQIRAHVSQVLSGERLGTFIFGGAGLGKNYIVLDELRKHGYRDVQPVSPVSVNDLLHQFHNATYRRKRALPLVFDEARLIFETAPNLNIMKLALDGGKGASRYHSGFIWFEEDNGFNEETGEAKVKKVRRQGTSLKAPIIAMTNKNLHELDRKAQDHAEALLSRVPPIKIPDDPLALWEYIVHLALTSSLISDYRGRSLSLEVRAQIIDWFTANLHNLNSVSVRTMESVRDTFAMSGAELLESDLNLLLKPIEKRSSAQPPRQLNWKELRKALTSKGSI